MRIISRILRFQRQQNLFFAAPIVTTNIDCRQLSSNNFPKYSEVIQPDYRKQPIRFSSTTTTTTSSSDNQIVGHNVWIEDTSYGKNGQQRRQRIHYEKCGHGQQVLLLMPGAIGTAKSDFLPQLTQLDRDRFTLIAWDPPGYGQSIPEERDFNDLYRRDAEMAAKFMKKLEIPRYSVLGWSDGAKSAMILTANESESIEKLVIWGANAYVGDEDRRKVSKVRDPRTSWSDQFRKQFIEIYGEQKFYKLWENWAKNYIEVDNICRERLDQIRCPVFLLHGDRDPMMSHEHYDYLLKNIENIRLHRFPKGKHNIHQRYAEEFNRMVEQFLLEN